MYAIEVNVNVNGEWVRRPERYASSWEAYYACGLECTRRVVYVPEEAK